MCVRLTRSLVTICGRLLSSYFRTMSASWFSATSTNRRRIGSSGVLGLELREERLHIVAVETAEAIPFFLKCFQMAAHTVSRYPNVL